MAPRKVPTLITLDHFSIAEVDHFCIVGNNNLFRLTGYHINNQQYSHYCYDTLGNLTVKGIGEATQGCSADYHYGTVTFDEATGRHTRGIGNAGVHAVRQITNSTHNLTLNYDNNGNMYSDGERTITYNADDQATRIHKAGVQQIDVGYGIGGRIWRQDTKKGDVPHDPNDASQGLADNENRITYYHGALETVVTTSGDNPGTLKRYTLGNIVLTYFANTQQWQKRVLVKDNQGSTMAVADQSGTVLEHYRYDPFGEQRTISTSYYHAIASKGYLPTTQRGYTGHEMLNNVNVIHMNGRIYDPTIGRFLQADPHIQAPDNHQNYNRYSYVLNNPMSYTDPSGYFFKWIGDALDELFQDINKALGKVLSQVVSLAITISFGVNADTIWQAAAAGFAASGISTGSLKGALEGALSAIVFRQIGESFKNGYATKAVPASEVSITSAHLTAAQRAKWAFVHAIGGGAMASISGGKFGSGFISAGVTKMSGAYLFKGLDRNNTYDQVKSMVISMAVGGTTSYLTGGKFGNGARTAVFQTAYNFLFRAIGVVVGSYTTYKQAKELGYSDSEALIAGSVGGLIGFFTGGMTGAGARTIAKTVVSHTNIKTTGTLLTSSAVAGVTTAVTQTVGDATDDVINNRPVEIDEEKVIVKTAESALLGVAGGAPAALVGKNVLTEACGIGFIFTVEQLKHEGK